jgi:hypothetical protein
MNVTHLIKMATVQNSVLMLVELIFSVSCKIKPPFSSIEEYLKLSKLSDTSHPFLFYFRALLASPLLTEVFESVQIHKLFPELLSAEY